MAPEQRATDIDSLSRLTKANFLVTTSRLRVQSCRDPEKASVRESLADSHSSELSLPSGTSPTQMAECCLFMRAPGRIVLAMMQASLRLIIADCALLCLAVLL